MSQQTSFLSSPTDRARVSLMGLKEIPVAGLRWGERLNTFLFVLQSQNAIMPL